jgi:NAD(P)H dehydrogenase (quinone)
VRIAVTGVGGRLGAQVVELLAATGDHDVVAVARRPLTVPVTTSIADYADRAALRTALRGVDTLVFVSSDGEAVNVLHHHENVVQAAVDNGVSHIVALSGLDADLESPFCYAVTYAHTERLLRESGCALSIARASIYTEFFLHWLVDAATTGQLRLPAGDGRISLVSRVDVARCLAALAVAAPTGRFHEITGPESLDLAGVAALTEHEWETPVRYVDLAPSEHLAEMARAGQTPWWMYAFSTMFESVRQQRWASVSDEVNRLTGRPSTSVGQVLAAHYSTVRKASLST